MLEYDPCDVMSFIISDHVRRVDKGNIYVNI